jgi:hypothetical protein
MRMTSGVPSGNGEYVSALSHPVAAAYLSDPASEVVGDRANTAGSRQLHDVAIRFHSARWRRQVVVLPPGIARNEATCHRQLIDVTLSVPVQQVSGDVIEPNTLAQIVEHRVAFSCYSITAGRATYGTEHGCTYTPVAYSEIVLSPENFPNWLARMAFCAQAFSRHKQRCQLLVRVNV